MSQVSKCYQEKLDLIEEMQKLDRTQKVTIERDTAELTKLRKELKDTKASMTRNLADAEAKNKKVMLEEMKRDASVAVLEARIKMASEAAAKGLDISFWGIQTWREKLAALKGEDLEVESPLEDTCGKIIKVSPIKAIAAAPSLEDSVMEEQDPEVVKEVEVTTPGNEGKID